MEDKTEATLVKLLQIDSNIMDDVLKKLSQLSWQDINPLMVAILQDLTKNNPQ